MIRWYSLLAIAILFNGTANILMKSGMKDAPAFSDKSGMVTHYLTSWPLVVGLVLFALNVIAWTQALSKLPLSVAYPIMVSMTLLIVIMGSALLFKESISWIQWVGFVLIVVGVACVTR